MRPVAPRALALLVSVLESSGGRVVEDALDPGERDAFQALLDCGALIGSEDVPVILCPCCGEQDVDPRRIGGILQGLCPECGYVPITNASLKARAADPTWLLGRLRTVFGAASRQASEELVPGALWKVCDHKQGRRTRRILLARRLADHAVHRSFREALAEKVERDNAVIIGTTPRSAAMLSDLSLPYVHLAEIVHFRSGALELDAERWAWCLKPAHLRNHEASPVFFENFRMAVIDGEDYTFSASQAAVLAYLHAAQGRKCHKGSIMEDIDSPQKNPIELFRHNPGQLAGFKAVADWDDFGHYWLRR
ncbi:MAG: hypothetical protein Q8O33_07305 [Pseudomonadota bacterium]|nr:hypothetical protein [Pseudomonadota bacterium]